MSTTAQILNHVPGVTPETTEQGHPDLLLVSSSGMIYTKSINGPVRSILTYPTTDYDGDEVKPDGGDWSFYPKHPYVNWSHRCPIGRGEVSHKTLVHNGKTATVAVGDTKFFYTKADTEGIDLRRRNPKTHFPWDREKPYTVSEVLEVSAQAERLIRDDIATGVSIEFLSDPAKQGVDWWDIPGKKSVLSNRPSRHFERWQGRGWAHARQPVNAGCHTILPSSQEKANAAFEKAITIAQTGKLPGGELVCKAIMDSFADLVSYRSPNVSVSVEGVPPTELNIKATLEEHANKVSQRANDNTPRPGRTRSKNERINKKLNARTAALHHTAHRLHKKLAEHYAKADPKKSYHYQAQAGYHGQMYRTLTHKGIDMSVNDNLIVKSDTQEGMVADQGKDSKKDGDCPSHGCQALLNAAQALLDSASNLEKDAARSDSPSVRKYAKKKAAQLKECAGDLKARAEKLKATFDSEDDDTDATDEEEYTPTAEEKAIETDENGALIVKSFDWTPRRMTFANIVDATPEVPAPPPENKKLTKLRVKAETKLAEGFNRLADLLDAGLANGKL